MLTYQPTHCESQRVMFTVVSPDEDIQTIVLTSHKGKEEHANTIQQKKKKKKQTRSYSLTKEQRIHAFSHTYTQTHSWLLTLAHSHLFIQSSANHLWRSYHLCLTVEVSEDERVSTRR